jgi:hypothetical protein
MGAVDEQDSEGREAIHWRRRATPSVWTTERLSWGIMVLGAVEATR